MFISAFYMPLSNVCFTSMQQTYILRHEYVFVWGAYVLVFVNQWDVSSWGGGGNLTGRHWLRLAAPSCRLNPAERSILGLSADPPSNCHFQTLLSG